jgi:hypothetical protein
VEVFLGHILQRGELIDAGVVDQDVQSAERLVRLREQPVDVGLLGEIACTAIARPSFLVISATTWFAPSLLEL